ncbi:MAG: 50S ribosomal protein L35 [Candidatus Eisenbacteria sp.]|nr:50S ribosomal protein L35 [Candidatus Eisenbacteria bacterium]
MPKIRTRRATAKRFKVTGSGRIRRRRANKGHLLTGKTRKRKRFLRQGDLVHATDETRIRRQLGLR